MLAQAGRNVLLLEKEVFPRFHIGESLLPYNQAIFKELGLLPALEEAGFVPKYGAQFLVGNASNEIRFLFSEGRYTRQPKAIQVERARFDHVLLRHAAQAGADIREGWTVLRFRSLPDRVEVTAQSAQGLKETFSANFLVDASGRGNVTGNQESLREDHPRLRKLAVFGHFEGVHRDPGHAGGDTVIVRLEDKWFWLIPITPTRTSVGCVMEKEAFRQAREVGPETLLRSLWEGSSVMRERMRLARPTGPVQTTTDFSYRNRRFVSHRLIRVGDAAGFMDPIFSAGVFLAMHSGKLAARAVEESLRDGDDGAPRFQAYERGIRRAMSFYWEMVEHFYTTPFMEIFMNPRGKWNIPAAVNAVLAGELEGGWRLRWRMRLFFWLVRMQRYVPLVPRIQFRENAPMPRDQIPDTQDSPREG